MHEKLTDTKQKETAAATLADVRKSMKIDYFEDDNLLK